jgi:hypothetical protein
MEVQGNRLMPRMNDLKSLKSTFVFLMVCNEESKDLEFQISSKSSHYELGHEFIEGCFSQLLGKEKVFKSAGFLLRKRQEIAIDLSRSGGRRKNIGMD